VSILQSIVLAFLARRKTRSASGHSATAPWPAIASS